LENQNIIKHIELFVRSIPHIPLSLESIQQEHLALSVISNMALKDEQVRVPQIYNYFPEEHIIHMSDAGSKDLNKIYERNGNINIPLLG
jgi:hypothetical protein